MGVVLATFWGPVTAAENGFSWSGFGTLGVTDNSNGDFEFVRDLLQSTGVENGVTTKTDSNLGLQLKYRFPFGTEAVVQAVSRHDQDGSFPPEITWAYLKHSITPAWQVRGGRLSWDVYMLSDSRNVGYSFLWVRPAIEYFGLQQLSHIDGADVVFTQPFGPGLFWFKLYGGFADEEFPLDGGGDYDLSGSRALGGHANYQFGNWRFRLGFAELELDNAFDGLQPLFDFMRGNNQTSAELADDMQLENAAIDHFVAGIVYDRGPFQAQVMIDRAKSETLLFNDFYAGYVTLSYRLDNWRPYVTFAGAETDRVSRDDTGFPAGSPPDRNIRAVLDGVGTDQHTISLGVRYDFLDNAALKFQVDQLWANEPTTSLMRNPEPDWDGRGTIVSATLDFVF